MALPTNVNYGTVVGQFLLAYSDSSDPDPNPDGVPAKGSIFFRPSPIKLLDAGSSPNPVTILPAVVEATLDSEGYLCGYGTTRGVRLVATDDPDLNPQDWTWTVEFRLTAQDDTPVSIPSFNIELPSNTTVDLTTASPVPDANGTYYLTGPAGPANVLSIGTVSTLEPGNPATASISGTSPSQVLSLGIPKGSAASVTVGSTTTGNAGTNASVTNSGTSSDAILNFTIPRGNTGATGATGATGPQGPAATIAVGTTTTGAPGTNASVTNSGTSSAAVFNFTVPRGATGATGPTGPQGPAATIAVGTVTTGAPGSSATVTNVGTSGAAVFNFSIPKGDTGDIGNISAASPITYASNTIGLDYNALVIDGGTA